MRSMEILKTTRILCYELRRLPHVFTRGKRLLFVLQTALLRSRVCVLRLRAQEKHEKKSEGTIVEMSAALE